MIKRLTLLAVMLVPLTTPADELVEVAPGLMGKLHVPQDVEVTRTVLLLHGWQGSMDEVGNLFSDLASELGARGIASLRFNFSGEGERVGYVVTSTIDSRINESEQAYRYLSSRYPEATRGVLGFSLGGLTAMILAAEHPDWFQTMVLWSAADAMSLRGGDPTYADAARAAVRDGRATYRTWAKTTLTREHLVSFVGVSASEKLARYPGAYLTIRGDRDYLPSHDRKWLNIVPTSEKAFQLIGGADHIFNVLERPKPDYGDRVIRSSADWFERTL